MSKITMEYSGKEYTLEYNRQSVKTMESQGFRVDQISSMPVTMIPMLFQGAFIKNHKGLKRATLDEIYDNVGDKNGLIVALAEMYSETVGSLMDENEEGNATWAVQK